MDNQKPKISFNASPLPPTHGAGDQSNGQAKATAPASMKATAEYGHDPLFNREEWERQLVAPAKAKAQAQAQAAASAPKPVEQPIPKPPGFAATGLMAQNQQGFVRRNARPLGAVAAVVVTFGFGVAAAFMLLDDTSAAPQQTAFSTPPASETYSEAPTRAALADLTDVSAETPSAEGATISELGATVLAGLQSNPAVDAPQVDTPPVQALEVLSDDELQQARESILAGGYDVETYEHLGVERIRLRADNAPLIDTQSSERVLEAVARGEVEMSKSLYTTEQELDVDTMTFDLVQVSLTQQNAPASSDAALDMSRKIFAASMARTQNSNGVRQYTVQKGDSLAYIALQFYGKPSAYTRIIEANRNILQSPDEIQTGQRLVIPS